MKISSRIFPTSNGRTINVNFNGVFYIVRQAIPVMSDGGAIVNMASQAAHLGGSITHGHYGATKGAILAFTRTLAKELGPRIRANAVSPGSIETPMIARNIATRGEEIVSRTPLRRLGKPEEIASVIAFLCSDAASFVTGETRARAPYLSMRANQGTTTPSRICASLNSRLRPMCPPVGLTQASLGVVPVRSTM